jgi:hypothetical protein
MNISEIITNPPRDEYIDNYSSFFKDSPVVAKIKNLVLKKDATETEIQYGLFDIEDRLVGYLSLYYYGKDIWVVSLVQLAQAYKGMGYGTFLYDYAIMNDKLKILSDATNTGGPHGSKTLWKSLYNKNKYHIVGYDTETDTILKDIHPDDIYNNKPNIRWLAIPPNETINEALIRIQQTMKKTYVVWYGPGTTTEDYFNY